MDGSMALYLCVDCGGSKTSVVISDSSNLIVARAKGGPSNFTCLGLYPFIQQIQATIHDALKSTTLPVFAAAWFAISGLDSPSTVNALTPLLSNLLAIPPGPRLIIANDALLLAAPLRIHPDISHAVTCIAGTGSICVSFQENNGSLIQLGRIGGWGWVLGDDGGGFNVGREALRQILLQHDAASIAPPSPPCTLRDRVLDRFGVTDVLELLPAVYRPDPPPEKRLSALSPLVFVAAFDDADPLALAVLRTCTAVLAAHLALLLTLGDDSDPRPGAVRASDSVICFGGSLFSVEPYRAMVLEDLAHRGHVFRYAEFVEDPAAMGAEGLVAAARRAHA